MKISEIKDGLTEPFPVELVRFRPGRQAADGKRTALAYVGWIFYAKRLNDLCYEFWQLSEPTIHLSDKKVVVSQSVFVCGVECAGVGEANIDCEWGNAVCVAWDQAFKRACALLGLGAYLYELDAGPVASDGKNLLVHDLVLATDLYLEKGYPVPDSILDKLEDLRTVVPVVSTLTNNTPEKPVENAEDKEKKIGQLVQYNKLSRSFLETMTYPQIKAMQQDFMEKDPDKKLSREEILAKYNYKEPTTRGSSYRRPWKTA